MKTGAVLTDTGSTKRSVIRMSRRISPMTFTGSHTLLPAPNIGPAAGFADLFAGRYWVIMPGEVPEAEVARFESFVTAMGSSPSAWTPTIATRCWR